MHHAVRAQNLVVPATEELVGDELLRRLLRAQDRRAAHEAFHESALAHALGSRLEHPRKVDLVDVRALRDLHNGVGQHVLQTHYAARLERTLAALGGDVLHHAVARAANERREGLPALFRQRVRPLRHHHLDLGADVQHLLQGLVLERLEAEEVDRAVQPRQRGGLGLVLAVRPRRVVCPHRRVVAEHGGEQVLHDLRGLGILRRLERLARRANHLPRATETRERPRDAGDLLAAATERIAPPVGVLAVFAHQRVAPEVLVGRVDLVGEPVYAVPARRHPDGRPREAHRTRHRAEDALPCGLQRTTRAPDALGKPFAHRTPEARFALAGLLRLRNRPLVLRDALLAGHAELGGLLHFVEIHVMDSAGRWRFNFVKVYVVRSAGLWLAHLVVATIGKTVVVQLLRRRMRILLRCRQGLSACYCHELFIAHAVEV